MQEGAGSGGCHRRPGSWEGRKADGAGRGAAGSLRELRSPRSPEVRDGCSGKGAASRPPEGHRWLFRRGGNRPEGNAATVRVKLGWKAAGVCRRSRRRRRSSGPSFRAVWRAASGGEAEQGSVSARNPDQRRLRRVGVESAIMSPANRGDGCSIVKSSKCSSARLGHLTSRL